MEPPPPHHLTPSQPSSFKGNQITPSVSSRTSNPNTPASKTPNKRKSRISEYVEHQQWHDANWLSELLEVLFRINERQTSINLEVYAGVIQFISCMYFLPVIPQKMESAGYNKDITFAVTGLTSAIGCILAGLFANLPFIIAPPAAISIFLVIFLQTAELDTKVGNVAVTFSGLSLILLGWPPLGVFVTKLIPSSIQVGTVVGIGLLTALAGATEVNMIITGAYTVVGLGKITPAVMLAIAGVIIIAISLHYQVKGAFCLALMIGTIIWWALEGSWPGELLEFPHLGSPQLSLQLYDIRKALPLYADLLFLYILTLSGLVFSLSALANLIREDGTTPRNRWIFIICGLATVISGIFGGPPILLSPESTAGIKAGARTGLSSIVCGILFAVSVFFAPVLKAIPSAATSPVLIIVGVFLFQNVIRVDWTLIKDSVPAFCILFFIPFTYSVLQGVAMGYLVYSVISLATGDLIYDAKRFWRDLSTNPFLEDGGYEYLPEGGYPSPPDIESKYPFDVNSSRSLIHSSPTMRNYSSPRVSYYHALAGEEIMPGPIDDRTVNNIVSKRSGIPIRKQYRGYSEDEIRRISSPRRQSMDGLDHSVQVHSGVLELSYSPSPKQVARSLPGPNMTLF